MKSNLQTNQYLKKSKRSLKKQPLKRQIIPKKPQTIPKPQSSSPSNLIIVTFYAYTHPHHTILTPTTLSETIDFARIADTVIFADHSPLQTQFVQILKTHPLPNLLHVGARSVAKDLKKEFAINVPNVTPNEIKRRIAPNKKFKYGFLMGIADKNEVCGVVRGVGLNLEAVHVVGMGDFEVEKVILCDEIKCKRVDNDEKSGDLDINESFDENYRDDKSSINENSEDINENSEDINENSEDINENSEDINENSDDINENSDDINEITDENSEITDDLTNENSEVKNENSSPKKEKFKKFNSKKDDFKTQKLKFQPGSKIKICLKNANFENKTIVLTDSKKFETLNGALRIISVNHINNKYPVIVSSGLFRFIAVPYLHKDGVCLERSCEGNNEICVFGVRGRFCLISNLKSGHKKLECSDHKKLECSEDENTEINENSAVDENSDEEENSENNVISDEDDKKFYKKLNDNKNFVDDKKIVDYKQLVNDNSDRSLITNKIANVVGFGLISDEKVELKRKCNVVGRVFKVTNKTCWVSGIFTSKLEGRKFIGHQIKSNSGIFGLIKSVSSNGNFRGRFDGRLNKNDCVILESFFSEEICEVIEFDTEKYFEMKIEKKEGVNKIKNRVKVGKIVWKKEKVEKKKDRIGIPKRMGESEDEELEWEEEKVDDFLERRRMLGKIKSMKKCAMKKKRMEKVRR